MKKLIFLAASLFFAGAVHAQSPIRIGIKAGLNLPNIIKDNGNNNFSTKINPGFNAGLTLDVNLIEGLAITPELLYSQKGYKLTSDVGEFTQTTNFIDIPVLATIKLGSSPLHLVVGPEVSFLLSTKNKFQNGFGSAEEKIVEDDTDRFKKSLFGGVIGFRYDINSNVDIHGRYALDFQKNNQNGSTQTPEYKNQVFSVGFGYKF
nr:porin family protein [Pedobacter sp. ASV19]